MIKVLCPRCPLSSEQEVVNLRQKVNECCYELQQKGYSKDDILKLSWERYPIWGRYRFWSKLVETMLDCGFHTYEICESEYLGNSKEWHEYIELEHMLIYEQKIPYDSPEWQAVIEKFRRKDGISMI